MKPTEDAFGDIPITVNGEVRRVSGGLTVAGLLDQLALPGERVAVEWNREILPRRRFPEVVLAAGDRLEIVQFVGGG